MFPATSQQHLDSDRLPGTPLHVASRAHACAKTPSGGILVTQFPNLSSVPKPFSKLFRQFRAVSSVIFAPILRLGKSLFALQNRERTQLLEEMTQMRELMPLLMKQRNGYQWTKDDRKHIRDHLRNLARISPYIILFVAPGGLFLLPIMAWWLDRRRLKRNADAQRARNEASRD